MKAHYSEFVRYCLRIYVKTQDEGKGGHPIFRTDAERENWKSCYSVLAEYSERDADVIAQLYRPGDTLPDKLFLLAQSMRIPQGVLWRLVDDVEYKIAKQRGLI